MGELKQTTIAALDEIWRKLRDDPRMPDRRRFEYVRAPVVEEPTRFPILYFEEGRDHNKRATTTAREHKVSARVHFFVEDRDPEDGQRNVRDRTLGIVEALTETADDRRLVVNGQALALNVECPDYGWGAFARNPRSNQIVFAGTVEVVVTLLI